MQNTSNFANHSTMESIESSDESTILGGGPLYENPFITYLNLAYPILFLMLGLPGNFISMVIWLRRVRYSPGSTCLFLGVMCGVDTYVLVHGCLRNWIRTLAPLVTNGTQLDLRVTLGCSAPLFLFTFTSDVSMWIIILLSMERTLSTLAPIAVKQACRLRNGVLSMATVIILLALINGHFFWTVEPVRPVQRVETPPEKSYCTFSTTNEFLLSYWQHIDFAIYSFVPLALILLLNIIMLVRLHRNRSLQRTQTSRIRSTRIRRTVVVMTISHFIFTMPIVVYFVGEESFNCGRHKHICSALQAVFIMLQLANHLTHFFIYSVTSSLFKVDLVTMCPALAYFCSSPKIVAAVVKASSIRAAKGTGGTSIRRPPTPEPNEFDLPLISQSIRDQQET